MNKPSVYFETTVVGHIAARQQSDIIVAARQLSSCRWWACRDKYRIVISQVVIDECSAGDSTAATERLELLADMANAETRVTIEQICRDCGYNPPSICSPDELLGA